MFLFVNKLLPISLIKSFREMSKVSISSRCSSRSIIKTKKSWISGKVRRCEPGIIFNRSIFCFNPYSYIEQLKYRNYEEKVENSSNEYVKKSIWFLFRPRKAHQNTQLTTFGFLKRNLGAATRRKDYSLEAKIDYYLTPYNEKVSPNL